MKAGIFDPYLDTLGGGERYMMTIAECLSKHGHQVDVFWKNKKIKEKLQIRFNLDLSEIKFCSTGFQAFNQGKNLFKKFKICRNYNLFIYLSDGSIPFLFSGKNIIHFQVPFHGVGGRSLLNRVKLRLVDKIICNSEFTKKFIDKEYGVNAITVYPPVDIKAFKPLKKEKIILSVGRFDSPLHAKNQDVLIDRFKRMIKENADGFLNGWKLILIGGMQSKNQGYINKLRRKAKNSAIEILVNVDFKTLQKFYGQAKIYWHAAGFGIDEEKEPEKVEHFGITTVEAMAAGCVPVVIKKGGQKEIVEHAINGFLWETEERLVEYTLQLIKEEKLRQKFSIEAVKSSKRFSKERFYEKIKNSIA